MLFVIPAIVLTAIITMILVCVCRSCPCCLDLVMKVYNMVFFGMIITTITTMYVPLLIKSGFGKNLCMKQCVEIETNFYVIGFLALYLYLVSIFSLYVKPI